MPTSILLDRKIAFTTVSGPTSYNQTTGIQVTINELQRIDNAIVTVNAPLQVNNFVHAVRVDSISGNVITIRVFRIDVTASAPATWAEVPNGTNISALQLNIVAIGN
jgi:hypothetical protein